MSVDNNGPVMAKPAKTRRIQKHNWLRSGKTSKIERKIDGIWRHIQIKPRRQGKNQEAHNREEAANSKTVKTRKLITE